MFSLGFRFGRGQFMQPTLQPRTRQTRRKCHAIRNLGSPSKRRCRRCRADVSRQQAHPTSTTQTQNHPAHPPPIAPVPVLALCAAGHASLTQPIQPPPTHPQPRQSLFSRFVRLGTPYVELDAQGRARPSIAALYNWRYRALGDLPRVLQVGKGGAFGGALLGGGPGVGRGGAQQGAGRPAARAAGGGGACGSRAGGRFWGVRGAVLQMGGRERFSGWLFGALWGVLACRAPVGAANASGFFPALPKPDLPPKPAPRPPFQSPEYLSANPGLGFDYQLVDVQDGGGRGESEPRPYYYQNLGWVWGGLKGVCEGGRG